MPTFDTPDPIVAMLNVIAGDVRVSAGERTETIVTLAPTDAANDEDRKAAEQTRVELVGDQLVVKVPRLRSWLPRSTGGSIDLTVELPAGSRVRGTAALADFACDGALGECRLKTSLGQIRVEQADTVHLRTSVGDVTLDRATGHAEVTVGAGEVRVGELDSTAVIKNSNGDTWVGRARDELRVSAANGNIAIDSAQAGVVAKSANGDVRIGEAVRDTVVLETRLGDLEVGIAQGTAAWLDVRAGAGRVHNGLEAADSPGAAAETVEVRARTSAGDVVIRRPS